MTDWKAKLKALHPCPEAYRWAIKHKTFREAWRMCERGDWMEWLLEECNRRHNETFLHTVYLAVKEVIYEYPWWSISRDGAGDEGYLQDAYIILDFMPDPPRLPEIAE